MDKTSSTPATDPEAGRVQALDDRFGKIETEQARQGGLLEQIAAKLGGQDGGKPPEAPTTDADPPTAVSPGAMAEAMRQAVRDVRAEEAQADADRQHAADHARLNAPEPEKTPREVMIRGKARLQKIMFGTGQ